MPIYDIMQIDFLERHEKKESNRCLVSIILYFVDIIDASLEKLTEQAF